MKNQILYLMFASMLASPAIATANSPVVEVYKSPYCGCCGQWIEHMQANGFKVSVHNTSDVVQYKYRFGVPSGYGSCHTAKVNGYLVEGHVPAREIKRLLRERPDARGLVVPGMPSGAPGMVQGNRKDRFEVLLVRRDGTMQTYARY
jgi:hypothetical protein